MTGSRCELGCTFIISAMILLGPRDENEASIGAERSLMDSLFNMSASAFL